MKNLKTFAVVGAVLAAVFCLVFASCGDGSPAAESVTYKSSDATNTYELEITQSTAKAVYEPKQGDSYVLTITPKLNGTPQKSSGTVQNKGAGGELTLKPSKADAPTFKVTATPDAGMTKIEGPITTDGGASVTAPGTVTVETTPNNPSGGGNGGGSDPGTPPGGGGTDPGTPPGGGTDPGTSPGGNEPEPAQNPLANTTWVHTESYQDSSGSSTSTATFAFSASTFTLTVTETGTDAVIGSWGPDTITGNGTYTVSGNTVSLTHTSEWMSGTKETGTISGDKLTISGTTYTRR